MLLILLIEYQAPTINWVKVMENLDHEGFNIPDEASFSLLMSIYRKACQVCSFMKYSIFEKIAPSEIFLKDGNDSLQDPFPLHAVCGSVWRNAEGQLSFLRHAVSTRPDVFTFAHSSRHLVTLAAVYKFPLFWLVA